MLTRSKVKLEESVRHVHQDLPYFNQEEERTQTHMYKQSKNPNQSKVSHHTDNQQFRSDYLEFSQPQLDHKGKNGNYSRNEILKELRQEYEILRSLPIDDNAEIHLNKRDYQNGSRLSQSSSVSSSMQSKKSSKFKASEKQFGSSKLGSKQLEAMHLEKKQLEIVIGNSMRKIEELLNNEILLKKTIHELKNQIEGKGGVHQEYEKTIKAMQKNIDELQQQLNHVEHQNEKTVQKMMDFSEKIRFLEGQLGSKQREIKQGFDEQKRLHDLIRIEKDKYLNLEIQCKTYKMEFDLLEKEKNNEMNRLIRQFESKQGGNEKEMAYIIKKLEEEIKEKDKKYHELLVEKEQVKRDKDRDYDPIVEKKNDKNYLEELMYKSRQINDYNNKALTDSMNMIIVKMAEIEKKNDATLKKEIESLKKKTDDNKRNTSEVDLLARITELQRMIEREVAEKSRLAEDIKSMKEHKYELQDKNKSLDKKIKSLQERQEELKDQIQQLEQIKHNFNSTYSDHKKLQEEVTLYTQKIRSLQTQLQIQRQYTNNYSTSFKEKEKKYEDQIRILKRKVDEAQFEIEKSQKEAQFNLNMLKTEHNAEIKRITEQKENAFKKIKDTELTFSGSQLSFQVQSKQKQLQIANLKAAIQALRLKSQEDINNQKQFYSEQIKGIQSKHSGEIKAFNQKFAAISLTNQRLISQISTYGRMDTELIQMRRALKQARTMNGNINHLWEIKEVQYGNINEILTSLKTK